MGISLRMGHLSKRMIESGKKIYSTDLINRGYSIGGIDFLKATENNHGTIITNPPYEEFPLFFICRIINIGI